jgi:cell fate regulator YaaT (PSP1 superfamily)
MTIKAGESAIVETARGLEFGEVCLGNRMIPDDDIVQPLRSVVRIATKEDIAHNEENTQKEAEAFKVCLDKIAEHKLDMKLVDAQYTFDNSKLLFYFTSAGRVDFRELVKDLASVFRTRIELRQIGIRDEAKLMGGLGACGRPLCCASFLSNFVQVSIKMAKEQSLSLNSNKISGACGRLMCCLRYEYDTYQQEIAKTPPVDSVVETPEGKGTVTEISPLAGTVKVKFVSEQEQTVKVFKRELCKIISKPEIIEEKN